MTRRSDLLLVLSLCISGCGDDAAPPPELPPLDVTCQSVEEGYGPTGTVAVGAKLIVGGLEVPWGIDWLPNGNMLVTERAGNILSVFPDGNIEVVARIELDAATQEGGLLGLAIHPQFTDTRWFYVYRTAVVDGAVVNRVERWKLDVDGRHAALDRVVVDSIPALQFHNGGRLRFGPDGHLYIGTGDAGEPQRAQDVGSLAGKILRVTDEGTIPDDNPFPGLATWVLGVRNTQGFDWRDDGRIVMTDHGPSGLPYEMGRTGHDEVNVVGPGDNLGWPDRYACEEGAGRVAPSMTWVQPMPPGGTAIYTGTEIPEWRGDTFVGVLGLGGAIGHLHRLRMAEDGNVILHETYFLNEGFGRIRDVAMGPDGGLYMTTSKCDGRAECADGDAVFRIVPR